MLPDPKMMVVEVADEEDMVVVVEVCTMQIYPSHVDLSPKVVMEGEVEVDMVVAVMEGIEVEAMGVTEVVVAVVMGAGDYLF